MQKYISLTYDGVPYDNWTPASLLRAGVPQSAIDEAVEPIERLARVRGDIRLNGGDTLSMLGTTADAATLALYGIASLVTKLSKANSLAEVREAAEPFAVLSANFLTKVDSGDIKLPFMLKGIDTVVTEIETRANAVSDALIQAQKG